MRRQLGFQLKNAELILNQFVAYMEEYNQSHITSELALSFVKRNKRASLIWKAKKMTVIRQFAEYHRMFDPKTEIPSALHCIYRRPQPHIYSDIEIKQLLRSCQKLIVKHSIHAWTSYAFFGLIAVTGMRIGEAIALSRTSVNFKLATITIVESKNQKSRRIPVHPSVITVLKRYSKFRDRHLRRLPEYFFVDDHGEKLMQSKVRYTFKKLCNLAGISKGKKFPRIADFRHTFAVKTLENFYNKEIKPKKGISILALYLGHENPKHTYWYLTATPKLMKCIVDGLENKFGGKK